jgi:ABC-type transporter Mla MlaB component
MFWRSGWWRSWALRVRLWRRTFSLRAREPSWLDLAETAPGPAHNSKEALKELIERRRQNDFVRRREFDHLRRLRRREPAAASDSHSSTSFPTTQTSANANTRAAILRKINETEAQMSRQWWAGVQDWGGAKRKPQGLVEQEEAPRASRAVGGDSHFVSIRGSSDPGLPLYSVPPLHEPFPESFSEPSDAPPSSLSEGLSLEGASSLNSSLSPPSDVPGDADEMQAPRRVGWPGGAGAPPNPPAAAAKDDGWVPTLSDPDLEDAAIRFANGDDAGALRSLRMALDGMAEPKKMEARVLACVDLARATGQKALYDEAVTNWVRHPAHDPSLALPPWFSMPERLTARQVQAARQTITQGLETDDSRPRHNPGWRSPELLDAAAAQALRQLAGECAGELALDWHALRYVTSEAVPVLVPLFARWCDEPGKTLVFFGSDSLERALLALTREPQAEEARAAMSGHWHLRLDALRLMGLRDAFDLAALDYGVSHAVPAPAWGVPQTQCVLLQGPSRVAEAHSEAPMRASESHAGSGDEADVEAHAELIGELGGDAGAALAALDKAMSRHANSRRPFVISCADLIRVDFAAAGGLLNWVTEQRAQGRQVQLRDVHRLVAVFFHVLGISEQARVIVGPA